MTSYLSFFASTKGSRPDEFEALVFPHIELLWGTAYRYTGNRADAEDLLQELFTRLYPHRDQLATVENLRPWLLRSLYNLFVDGRRRWSRNVLSRVDQLAGDKELSLMESEIAGPEAEIEASHCRQAIFESLAVLDPNQRAVIVMHDMEGYTLQELQQMLDVPIGTLKSRLFRARRRLRNMLGEEPFGERQRANEYGG